MPYSPVPAALRRRSRQACDACRSSKKRCDAKLPCTNCQRRGVGSKCLYSSGRGRPLTPSTSTPERSIEHRAQDEEAQEQPAGPEQDSGVAFSSREGSPPLAQDPRMLLNAKGEKVYVGASASISFLQFLRQLLRRYAGHSTFTDSQKRHTMLEAAMPTKESAAFADNIDLPAKISLTQICFQADAQRLLEASTTGLDVDDGSIPIHRQDQVSIAYLMIAIGARCRWKDEADARCSSYFIEAQRMAFGNMLHDPSIGMVINFVLMAFYMCCACRRNTALLYLGIALRAATVLGLHQAHLDRGLAPEARELRVRAWKSLSVMDLYCNAILGRPSSTFDVLCQPSVQDETVHTIGHHMRALDANYQLCSIIESISLQLSRKNSVELDMAEGFLQRLRTWARSLPDGLRLTLTKETPGVSEATHREMSVGNVHIACSYYFGVILTTRQFLVSSITSRIRQRMKRSKGIMESTSRTDGASNPKVAELASVCCKSAVYMVQMCHEAGSWDLLLGNMCLLQLSQDDEWPPEVYGASIMASGVLEKLSKASPQAQRYHEILLQFLDAVESYQNTNSPKPAGGESEYLERILRPRTGVAPHRSGYSTPGIAPLPPQPEDPNESSSLSVRPFDEFLWNQHSALVPQVSDDLGFQMLWDELSPHMFMGDDVTQFSGEPFSQLPWEYGGDQLE